MIAERQVARLPSPSGDAHLGIDHAPTANATEFEKTVVGIIVAAVDVAEPLQWLTICHLGVESSHGDLNVDHVIGGRARDRGRAAVLTARRDRSKL